MTNRKNINYRKEYWRKALTEKIRDFLVREININKNVERVKFANELFDLTVTLENENNCKFN